MMDGEPVGGRAHGCRAPQLSHLAPRLGKCRVNDGSGIPVVTLYLLQIFGLFLLLCLSPLGCFHVAQKTRGTAEPRSLGV